MQDKTVLTRYPPVLGIRERNTIEDFECPGILNGTGSQTLIKGADDAVAPHNPDFTGCKRAHIIKIIEIGLLIINGLRPESEAAKAAPAIRHPISIKRTKA
jgi:hypothetical protein